MEEINIYRSGLKPSAMLLLCLVFVFAGIWLLTTTDAPRYGGWASIILFGAGAITAIHTLTDASPQISISEAGLYSKTGFQGTIPWDMIQSASVKTIFLNKFIKVVFRKDNTIKDSYINLGTVKVNGVKFASFITEMANEAPETRRSMIKQLKDVI